MIDNPCPPAWSLLTAPSMAALLKYPKGAMPEAISIRPSLTHAEIADAAIVATTRLLIERAITEGGLTLTATGALSRAEARTHDGRKFRMLNVVDEFSRECLAIRVARNLKAVDVIDVLSDLFMLRGVPGHVRSDNDPEFVARPASAKLCSHTASVTFRRGVTATPLASHPPVLVFDPPLP